MPHDFLVIGPPDANITIVLAHGAGGAMDTTWMENMSYALADTLICQGTRDLFESREEVSGFKLANKIEILWLEDGDHDFRPRKAISGLTIAEHVNTVANHVSTWMVALHKPAPREECTVNPARPVGSKSFR